MKKHKIDPRSLLKEKGILE